MEQNRKAAACIEENLNHTHLREKAVVMSKDVMTALRILEDKKQAFDYIFMDPPYGKLLEKEAVLYLDGSVLCDENTTIIIESDLDTEFSWVMDTGFTITKERFIRRISTLSFRKSKEKNITKVEEQTKLWQQQFTREVLTRLL